MIKGIKYFCTLALLTGMLSSCAASPKLDNTQPETTVSQAASTAEKANSATKAQQETINVNKNVDLAKVQPNEAGRIMVVMFHNFIDTYKSGDKEYTTTFDDFRTLLQTLYDKGYRLINVNDYLTNNIKVSAGFLPMVFTFDDGTAGQFNLVEENGKLVVNKQSAVGILLDFNKQHPDFGIKGTFYVNLGLSTFDGKGTVPERLKYLTDLGFEIGNHTLTHVHLPDVKTEAEIEKEVGGNQKKMNELIPGYKFTSLALPFGQASKSLMGYVAKGEYQGTAYENQALMLVGANPAPSPVSPKFNPLSTPRVRASGIKKVDCDLDWWLAHTTKDSQYISDGDPDTVTVPKSMEKSVDQGKLQGKTLRTY